jgi:DUF305 family protein family protein
LRQGNAVTSTEMAAAGPSIWLRLHLCSRRFFPILVVVAMLGFASRASSQNASSAQRVTDRSGLEQRADTTAEAGYLAEIDSAMTGMMRHMVVKPTGDIDRDFAAMMIAHHHGAIDMAMALLRHGHNEQLKRLAQEIIVTQQQEIVAMRRAVGEPPPQSTHSQPEPISAEPSRRQTIPADTEPDR